MNSVKNDDELIFDRICKAVDRNRINSTEW